RTRGPRPTRSGSTKQPWIAAGPDRAEGVSHRFERLHVVVQIPRGKFESLANILRFKFGILAAELIPVRIVRERLDDTPHGKAHTPDRGPPVEDIRVGGDS